MYSCPKGSPYSTYNELTNQMLMIILNIKIILRWNKWNITYALYVMKTSKGSSIGSIPACSTIDWSSKPAWSKLVWTSMFCNIHQGLQICWIFLCIFVAQKLTSKKSYSVFYLLNHSPPPFTPGVNTEKRIKYKKEKRTSLIWRNIIFLLV